MPHEMVTVSWCRHTHTHKVPLDIELMRQPHSSAHRCDSVMVSSHADTASRSIELNDSDSVAIANDTLPSCRRTLTSSQGQGTVHRAARVRQNPVAQGVNSGTASESSHTTQSTSISRNIIVLAYTADAHVDDVLVGI
jgi:hypothetical protein